MAVAEQLHQIVPDERRIEQLSGTVADGAVIDRVHGVADCGDSIVDHDDSVPDLDRADTWNPVWLATSAVDTCVLVGQCLPRGVMRSRARVPTCRIFVVNDVAMRLRR